MPSLSPYVRWSQFTNRAGVTLRENWEFHVVKWVMLTTSSLHWLSVYCNLTQLVCCQLIIWMFGLKGFLPKKLQIE